MKTTVVKLLLDHGLDPKMKNTAGQVPGDLLPELDSLRQLLGTDHSSKQGKHMGVNMNIIIEVCMLISSFICAKVAGQKSDHHLVNWTEQDVQHWLGENGLASVKDK